MYGCALNIYNVRLLVIPSAFRWPIMRCAGVVKVCLGRSTKMYNDMHCTIYKRGEWHWKRPRRRGGRKKPRALAPDRETAIAAGLGPSIRNRGGDASPHTFAATTIQRVINIFFFLFLDICSALELSALDTWNIYNGRPCSISVNECGYDEHESSGIYSPAHSWMCLAPLMDVTLCSSTQRITNSERNSASHVYV